MKYKITIVEIVVPPDGKSYQNEKEIYEQVIEDLDVIAVIKAANDLVEDA